MQYFYKLKFLIVKKQLFDLIQNTFLLFKNEMNHVINNKYWEF